MTPVMTPGGQIRCPQCSQGSGTLIFHCLRCGSRLVDDVEANGIQVLFTFAGGVAHPVAVQRRSQAVTVARVELSPGKVTVTLPDGKQLAGSSRRLFDVLSNGEQLWNIDDLD